MAHNRKSRYYAEPGESFEAWRAKHFDAAGSSKETGEKYEEQRLQSMYWFRSQRFAPPVARISPLPFQKGLNYAS